MNEIWRFDTLSSWVRCGKLIAGRRCQSVTAVGANLYILGGYTRSEPGAVASLYSIEQFNTLTNRCHQVGRLAHAVVFAASVAVRSCIYLFGGPYSVDREAIQMYDTAKQTCIVLRARLPHSLGLLRTVLFQSMVILVSRGTCLLFDLDVQTWKPRPQFHTEVHHFGVALENGTIYVIGGGTLAKGRWIGKDDIKSVSIRSIVEDQPALWVHHAKLDQPRLIVGFGTLSLPI